ncbi:methyl-accepting chemotaxis protein [Klenkia marina]|uniref:Methyl-accepting chemotaxis protein n=1 Tax=Klenkia marina TaxID=1960309 RepID=A0A1G4XT17_9ACTN|nr:methyl-accepting chemotaxis protein [Klenkia marina]SCX44265.1 methyl-accepting chemotaxis protein [Klenkia marina]
MSTSTALTRFWGDRSVKTKVLAAVATASAVAGAIGVVGIVALNDSSATTQRIYESNLTSVAAIAAMNSDMQDVRIQNRNAILAADQDATRTALQAADDAAASFVENTATYTSVGMDDQKWALVNDATTQLQTAQQTADQVTAPLALANAYDEWVTANDAQIRPLFDKIQDDLDQLTQLESAQAAEAAAAAQASATRSRTSSIVILVVGVLAALSIGYLVASGIARSVKKVQDAAEGLAQGDLTVSVGLTSKDELGRMASSIDTALVNLRGVMAQVVTSADAVAASSEELSASAAQISASSEETSVQSTVVSGAADEVSRSVATVAAGAEEMSASIREIAQNANEAARVAAEAVSEAEATNQTIQKLGLSSKEIGDVVKVITSIAEQTNLLALNATIEAARAGEAGKGFAVVANEVKELAQETARATEDIARRVEAIQADTGGAVDAIGRIGTVIGQINDYQLTIASAVEEQTATTNEMSRSVAEAAGGTTEIAANITGVSTAADSTTQALSQTRVAVDELSRMAADLRTSVSTFTY